MAALKKRYYQKIDEEVYSAILDSGMSLSIIKKKGFVEKAALLSTNFGALDNHFYIDGELQSYPAGIAHFLEHKLFEDEQGRDVTVSYTHLAKSTSHNCRSRNNDDKGSFIYFLDFFLDFWNLMS